jgi:hypothetical protein
MNYPDCLYCQSPEKRIRSANPLAAATTARIVMRGTQGKEQDYE